jgi:hypothetical protein
MRPVVVLRAALRGSLIALIVGQSTNVNVLDPGLVSGFAWGCQRT